MTHRIFRERRLLRLGMRGPESLPESFPDKPPEQLATGPTESQEHRPVGGAQRRFAIIEAQTRQTAQELPDGERQRMLAAIDAHVAQVRRSLDDAGARAIADLEAA